MKKKALLFALVIFTAFFIAGCGILGGNKDDTDNDPGIDLPVPYQPPFFDLSRLNYSAEYSNPDAPEEKGYIIYDYINFDRISYTTRLKGPAKFYVYYGGELIETIEMAWGATSYRTFALNYIGEYTIQVKADDAGGKPLHGEFKIKVSGGGYPDRVEFEIYDALGNKVQSAQAGEQYRLIAKVCAGNELLTEDNAKFTAKWQDGQTGSREITVTIPNFRIDGYKLYTFQCTLHRGTYNINRNEQFKVDVVNNYAGITFDYGDKVTDGEATLDVTESFFYQIKAYHTYTNGDRTEISGYFGTGTLSAEKVIAFIKYGDSAQYARYHGTLTDFSSTFTYYFNNGTSYYFDPRETSCSVYLAYTYEENSSIKYRKLDGSDVDITLTKTTPESITVTSISGREKRAGQNEYPTFSNRAVVDDAVSVKIMVNTATYKQERQHFILNIQLSGGGTCKDYYFAPGAGIAYSTSARYFYAFQAGEKYIDIISCFGNASYRLNVNVENPVTARTLDIKGDYRYTFFIGEPDFSSCLKAVERYYNDTESDKDIGGTYEIAYFEQNGQERSQSYFAARDDMYEGIVLKLRSNGQIVGNNTMIVSFFILPDLALSIKGTEYRMSEAEESVFVNFDLVANGGDYSTKFVGHIPKIMIEGELNPETDIEILTPVTGVRVMPINYFGYCTVVYDELTSGSVSSPKVYNETAILRIIPNQ